MKKNVLLTALVLFIGLTSVNANDHSGKSEKAVKSFQKDFQNATEVTWNTTGKILKVTFSLNDQVFTAFYNEEGERLAIARNLKTTELPMGLLRDLKESYAQYWVSDLFEISNQEEAAYYVTIENADYKITLKSVGMYDWIVYRRSEK